MKRGHDGRPFVGPPQSFPPPPVYYPPPQMHAAQYPMQKSQVPTSGYVHVSHAPPPNAYPNYGYGQLPPRNNYQGPPTVTQYPLPSAYPHYPPPPPSAPYVQHQFQQPPQPQIYPPSAAAGPSYATPPYQQVVALNTTPPGHGPPAKKPRHDSNKNTTTNSSSTPSSATGGDNSLMSQTTMPSSISPPVTGKADNNSVTLVDEDTQKITDPSNLVNKSNLRKSNNYRATNVHPQQQNVAANVAKNLNGQSQFFAGDESQRSQFRFSNGDNRGRGRGNGPMIKTIKHLPIDQGLSTGAFRSTNRGRRGLSRGSFVRGINYRSRTRDPSQRDDTHKDTSESRGKRTLTDFRISRLSIPSLGWEWETIVVPPSSESVSETTGKHRRDEDDLDEVLLESPHKGKGKKVKADVERQHSNDQDHKVFVDTSAQSSIKLHEVCQESPLLSASKQDYEKPVDKTDEDVSAEGVARLSVNESEPISTETINVKKENKSNDDIVANTEDENKEFPEASSKQQSQSRKTKRNLTGVVNGRENSRLRIYFASPIVEPMRTMNPGKCGQPHSTAPSSDQSFQQQDEEKSLDSDNFIPLSVKSTQEDEVHSSEKIEKNELAKEEQERDRVESSLQSSVDEEQTPQKESLKEISTQTLPEAPSADRISISYARNSHRILIDASVVDKILVYRNGGRIEVTVRVEPVPDEKNVDPNRVCKGFLIEALDPETGIFTVVDRHTLEESTRHYIPPHPEQEDENTKFNRPCLPPLWKISTPLDSNGNPELNGSLPKTICVIAYLDKHNPLTEARWLRNGDADAWIAQMTGQGVGSSWCGKIQVVDPDPAPTFQHALNSWKDNSNIGSKEELESFVNDHMSNIDNVVEILLRIVRGDHRIDKLWSRDGQSSAVATLATKIDAPYPDRQTHVSLATFALFKLAVDTAKESGQDLSAIHRKASDIVRALPYNLLFKALDTMARDYLVEKRTKAYDTTENVS